jgi:hypothetical protein
MNYGNVAVAVFGLILTIFSCLRSRAEAVPFAVGLYITAACWFTASTSFASRHHRRSMTDSFAGIAPAGILPFIASQLVGMLAGVAVAGGFSGPAQALRALSRQGGICSSLAPNHKGASGRGAGNSDVGGSCAGGDSG